MKIIRFLLGFLCAAFIVGTLVTVAMIVSQTVMDAISNDGTSVSGLLRRAKFQRRVIFSDMQCDEHEIHKGYGSIELIARFVGLEEMPAPPRGRERWTNSEFYAELRRVFPQYQIVRHSNLRNAELINIIYDALVLRNPAIVFHAAKVRLYDTAEAREYGEYSEIIFEKRYSVIWDIDLPRDRIRLNDPHGSFYHVTFAELIRSTRFEDYEKSFFDILTFAFRRYQRNTVFIIERTPSVSDEDEENEEGEAEYEQIIITDDSDQ